MTLTDSAQIQFGIIIFVIGACIGSFLNVCIYRLPAGKSIATPGSMCLKCGGKIRFYDNIPIISYLVLKGKCRQCAAPISIRYPMIELMSGLFALAVFLHFGITPAALIYYVFIATLLVITFIDIDHRIIPDVISLPGIPIFFLAAIATALLTWKEALLGILIGGGILLLIALLYYALTRKEGMGMGDVKLLAMIGALVGWKGVFFTIFVSSAVGTLSGLLVMLVTRQNMKLKIPFGPFLAIGAVVYIFYGSELIRWYLHVL